mmetsp:Transcript_11309/g.42222  ORF Transcript_11309/g.42222 Transcript_11309/m.42222 type:complete len:102 (+) Transcript_11309:1300-1605(+)
MRMRWRRATTTTTTTTMRRATSTRDDRGNKSGEASPRCFSQHALPAALRKISILSSGDNAALPNSWMACFDSMSRSAMHNYVATLLPFSAQTLPAAPHPLL